MQLILRAYGKFRVNASTLEKVLKHNYGKTISHNRIHRVLKEAGGAMPQPSKQRRRRRVRYEREHSMSLGILTGSSFQTKAGGLPHR